MQPSFRSEQIRITPIEDSKGHMKQVGPINQHPNSVLHTQKNLKCPAITHNIKGTHKDKSTQSNFVVKDLRSPYRLKEGRRIWYQQFKAEMASLNFVNDDITPCLFIKQDGNEFVIIAIYVDDINIFWTPTLTTETTEKLQIVFKMKDIRKPSFCLGLQFDYLPDGILLIQSTYTKTKFKTKFQYA